MIKILKDLSQILATTGVSSSQEEQILTVVKNLSTSLEVIAEPDFYDPQPHEELESSNNHVFQSLGETEDLWATSVGEKLLNLEIGEAKEEDMQHCPNEEMDQDRYDYIKHWFQTSNPARHHSLLHTFLASYNLQLLVLHAHVHCKIYMLNLSMNISLYLIRTWIHWKFYFN